MEPLQYRTVRVAPQQNLATIAQHMFSLMLRNLSSDGYLFTDPTDPSQFSRPGCIIASPSYRASLPTVDQDYVFNWTRDAAITAMELAAADLPVNQPLIDYVTFAQICQQGGSPIGYASYTIEGLQRPDWSEQTDGPALQTLAILQMYPELDSASQSLARQVIATDIGYLLNVYRHSTRNLWEERDGYSFFARAVQTTLLHRTGGQQPGDSGTGRRHPSDQLAAGPDTRALEQHREHIRHLRRA
jgi:glucoamylase